MASTGLLQAKKQEMGSRPGTVLQKVAESNNFTPKSPGTFTEHLLSEPARLPHSTPQSPAGGWEPRGKAAQLCLALSATRGYWASAARLPMLEQVWHMLSLRTSSSLEVRSSRSPSVRSKAVSGKSPPKLHRGSDKSVAELSDH